MILQRAKSYFQKLRDTYFHQEISRGCVFTCDLIPSLGATGNNSTKLRKHIISPYSRRYRTWNMILVLLVIYSAWICPFELAFLEIVPPKLLSLDYIVDCFFAVDIVLTFFVAYLDNKTYALVDDQKKIAKRHLSTWFIFDVCSVPPIQPLDFALKNHRNSLVFRILYMLRLWRLRRVSSLFSRLEKDIRFNYFWIRCTKLISVTLFAVHCAGCFNYLIADRYPNPKRTWIGATMPNFKAESLLVRYVTAIYWSMTTLTTTGYGDLHAENPREMLFDTFFMMFSLALTAYLIGNMTNLVVQATNRTRKFRDRVQGLSEFAARNQLPDCLKDQILSLTCVNFRTEEIQQQEMLNSLPRGVRSNIACYLFFPIVRQLYLFNGASDDFISQMVSEMQVEFVPPKVNVMLQNEASREINILASGAVDLILKKDGTEQIYRRIAAVDMFGVIGVLCNKSQPFTARTVEFSQILRLSRTVFTQIILENMDNCNILMNNFIQKLKLHQNLFPSICEINSTPSHAYQYQGQEHLSWSSELQGVHTHTSSDRNVSDKDHEHSGNGIVEHSTEYNKYSEEHNTWPDNRFVPMSGKRVVIHIVTNDPCSSRNQNGKLINLPESLEELLRVAGDKFDCPRPNRVVNQENSEIDDIAVIRDGDRLFLC